MWLAKVPSGASWWTSLVWSVSSRVFPLFYLFTGRRGWVYVAGPHNVGAKWSILVGGVVMVRVDKSLGI